MKTNLNDNWNRRIIKHILRQFFIDIRECDFTDETSLAELNEYISKWVEKNLPPDMRGDNVK